MKGFCISVLAGIFALATLSSYLLFFHPITESRYNKIMDYYIAANLTRRLATFKEKVAALRNFVHENVHPISGYDNRLDTVGIDKLLSGIGWCDQQSRVFMQLGRAVGITSRLLFLLDNDGNSPHSVVEVLAPDKRWVLVSVLYNIEFINKDGKFATQADIKKHPDIVINNRRIKQRARFNAAWRDPKFLAIYSNTPIYVVEKKGVYLDLLRPILLSWLRPIINILQERYLEGKRDSVKDIYEFKMLKARGYHLLGYYDKSERLYAEIIRRSDDPRLRYKAEFYRALLLKDKGEYYKAYKYVSRLVEIENESLYIDYLYGLRANILNRLGSPRKAELDLLRIKYLLRAY